MFIFYTSCNIAVLLLLLLIYWYYFPGWDLTSSLSFSHFCIDCALILQFLHPTCVTSFSNLSHHLIFGLPRFLSPFTSALVQGTFFAESLSSIFITCPPHLSLPNSINFISYSSHIQECLASSNIPVQVPSQIFSIWLSCQRI